MNRHRLQFNNEMKQIDKPEDNKVQVKYYTKINNPIHFYEFYPEKLYCLDKNEISIYAQKIKISQPKVTKEKKSYPNINVIDKNIREAKLPIKIHNSKIKDKTHKNNEASQQKSLTSEISRSGINLLASSNSKKKKSSSLLPITSRPKANILSFSLKRNAKSPIKASTNKFQEESSSSEMKNRSKIRTLPLVKKDNPIMPIINEEIRRQEKKIVKNDKEYKPQIQNSIRKESFEEKAKPKQKFVYVPMDLAYTVLLI